MQNKPLVRQVVVLLVHGLDSENPPPELANTLGPPIGLRARKPTMEPGHTAFSLLTHPPPGAQPNKVRRRASDPGQGNASVPPPESYKLTLDQLEEHGYPLPVLHEEGAEMEVPQGYVATRGRTATASPPASFGRPTHHRMVALDCEMCVTSAGLELTRLVLLDEWGDALLDELVAPHNPIIDYVTRYSGITPKMMEGVTTRLEDVQARFCEIVRADALLIAHSGENDLHALKACRGLMCSDRLLLTGYGSRGCVLLTLLFFGCVRLCTHQLLTHPCCTLMHGRMPRRHFVCWPTSFSEEPSSKVCRRLGSEPSLRERGTEKTMQT